MKITQEIVEGIEDHLDEIAAEIKEPSARVKIDLLALSVQIAQLSVMVDIRDQEPAE